jgi:hypothetical protein
MNTKNRFPYILLVFSLALASLLGACASAGYPGETRAPTGAEQNMAPPSDGEGSAPWEAPSAPMATPALSMDPASGKDASYLASSSVRMVIKDGQMELLVQDTDQVLARVTQLAADQGGYIISTNTWHSDVYKYASVRMGVPAASFETTLNALRLMGLQVLQENASGQDVSTEYRDLQSRLVNLEATTARVRAFLEEARNVEESLRINQTLSDLEGQIETIKGQMTFYERRSAFSTITVNLTPQFPTPTPTPTPTPPPGWNPGGTFTEATGALTKLGQVLADMFIWFSVLGGPFIIAGLIVLWVLHGMRKLWKRI